MNGLSSPADFETRDDVVPTDRRSPAWGAILAGAITGLAVHFLILMLFTAVGLGASNPATDANPVETFSVGTAIAWSISALISLFIGGWMAGRCAARVHSVSGAAHGFLVWCVATVTGLLLIAGGAGMVVGGAASVMGRGLSAAAKPLSGVADLAKDAVAQNTSALGGMVDEVAENPQIKNAATGPAAKREIGEALRELFRDGGNLRDPKARDATVAALTRSGVSQPDANRMVDSWTASMEKLRAQLDQAKTAAAAKAREVAEATSKALATGALWTFVGFLIGAIASILGGRRGQAWEYQHTEIGAQMSLDPTRRSRSMPTPLPEQS